MGNAQVPPGCQRAPARLVANLGEEGADTAAAGAAGVGVGTRGSPPQFGAGCGFHGGPDTGYVAKLGDGPNPDCTTSPSLTELDASLQNAAVAASKLGEVDVAAPGRRSNAGNEGCIYHCGVPVQEKVAPCEHDGGQVSVDCPVALKAEASFDSAGAVAARLLSCALKVPESKVASPQAHKVGPSPGGGDVPDEEKSRTKFESWDFPFEAQPTLMLARFKALPSRGRRPQAPGDKVIDDDDHEFGWLAALLGGESPCSAATVLGVDCCSVGQEALAGSKAPARKLGSGAR